MSWEETLFFLQIKNIIHYIHIKGYSMAKNSFLVEVTFNRVCSLHKYL